MGEKKKNFKRGNDWEEGVALLWENQCRPPPEKSGRLGRYVYDFRNTLLSTIAASSLSLHGKSSMAYGMFRWSLESAQPVFKSGKLNSFNAVE